MAKKSARNWNTSFDTNNLAYEREDNEILAEKKDPAYESIKRMLDLDEPSFTENNLKLAQLMVQFPDLRAFAGMYARPEDRNDTSIRVLILDSTNFKLMQLAFLNDKHSITTMTKEMFEAIDVNVAKGPVLDVLGQTTCLFIHPEVHQGSLTSNQINFLTLAKQLRNKDQTISIDFRTCIVGPVKVKLTIKLRKHVMKI